MTGPFMMVESGCHFQIVEESWNELYDSANELLKIPKVF